MLKKASGWVAGVLLLGAVLGGAQAQSGAVPAGQIAIADLEGNIQRYDMASQTLSPVTTDARLQMPVRFYAWPTWASDGQLAFFGVDRDPANPFNLGIFIQASAGPAPRASSLRPTRFSPMPIGPRAIARQAIAATWPCSIPRRKAGWRCARCAVGQPCP
ncbi:MAG: hypothetical protein HC915_15320 [Anaerolineae bacterium]|nr:hypothetical protein [Anaerolineae bacterium]